MRNLSFICVLAFTIAIYASLDLTKYGQMIMQRLSTKGEPLYHLCEDPAKHVLQAKSISIDPEQPIVGKDITVKVVGVSRKTITGGKLKVQLTFGFIKLNKELDFCQALQDYTDVKCPLTEGEHTITVKESIPESFPPFPVNGEVHAWDQDGELITCTTVKFQFAKPNKD